MSADPDAIAARLAQTLPPGKALIATPLKWLYSLLLASADELARIYDSVSTAIDEGHPATATETLDDWEQEYGLPEPGYPPPSTMEQRRQAIETKAFAAFGGQSRAYFISIADSLGVAVTIEEPQPFELGISGMGDPIGGLRWRFIWYVHCPAGTTGVMEPIFQRYKPAHTEVFFVEDL